MRRTVSQETEPMNEPTNVILGGDVINLGRNYFHLGIRAHNLIYDYCEQQY
jgi:hypothetical protein